MSETIPSLMHFPLARRYAQGLVDGQFYRIRRSIMNAQPTLLTNLTSTGDTSSITLYPGVKKLAWFEYHAGLWYVTTWQEIGSPVTTDAATGLAIFGQKVINVTRVVTAADFTIADMQAEDWTILDVGCDLKTGACACATAALLAKVPTYPVPEDQGDSPEAPFDLAQGNARIGIAGCDTTLNGDCTCAGTSTTTTNTGTVSDPNLGGGGGGGGALGSGAGGDSSGAGGGGGLGGGGRLLNNLSGGTVSPGGDIGGGNTPPKRPVKQPKPTSSNSVDVTVNGPMDCYDKTQYTALSNGKVTLDPPPHFFGSFTLNAPNDGSLWFFKVKFRGNVISTGQVAGGSNIGFDLGEQSDAQPGDSWPVMVDVHLPGQNPDDKSGSATCSVPGWCDASRSRTPDGTGGRRGISERRGTPARRSTARRADSRRTDDRRRDGSRRRDDSRRRDASRRDTTRRADPPRRPPTDVRRPARRPDPPRRPARRPPPSYGISVEIYSDHPACYQDSEVTDGMVPGVNFTGSFAINAPDGNWSYSVVFDGNEIDSGTVAATASKNINWNVNDAAPNDHYTVTVHANRIDADGVADGGTLANVKDRCTSCANPHEHLNVTTNSCDCDDTWYRDGDGNCVQDPSCGSHEHADPQSHACVCDDGYHRDSSGNCVENPNCSQHAHYDEASDQCVCDDGYTRSDSGICTQICGSNQHADTDGHCVCDDGFHLDESENCVANPTCSGANEVLDIGSLQCVCASGFERNSNGDCVAVCGSNMHRDSGSGNCVCNDGYHDVSGDCVPDLTCPEHAHIEGASCTCDAGYHDNGSGGCDPD